MSLNYLLNFCVSVDNLLEAGLPDLYLVGLGYVLVFAYYFIYFMIDLVIVCAVLDYDIILLYKNCLGKELYISSIRF